MEYLGYVYENHFDQKHGWRYDLFNQFRNLRADLSFFQEHYHNSFKVTRKKFLEGNMIASRTILQPQQPL